MQKRGVRPMPNGQAVHMSSDDHDASGLVLSRRRPLGHRGASPARTARGPVDVRAAVRQLLEARAPDEEHTLAEELVADNLIVEELSLIHI